MLYLYLRARAWVMGLLVQETGGVGTTAAIAALAMIGLLLVVAAALSGPASEAKHAIDAIK